MDAIVPMDIGLRAWLLILGSVFILVILIHGYWRMRTGRNPIKMQLDKSLLGGQDSDRTHEDDINALRAELPSGGARLAGQQGEQGEQTSLTFSDADNDQENTLSSDPHSSESEKMIIFYLIANNGMINGQVLLESLVPWNLEFGEMGIFHLKTETGQVKFSLANAVEPGNFELNSIKELETPGVIMFMKVHEQTEPDVVFDEMLEVARSVSEELDCQMMDESQSVVTPQTIQHYRQSILDFSHKRS